MTKLLPGKVVNKSVINLLSLLTLLSLLWLALPATAKTPKGYEATTEDCRTGSTQHIWSDGHGHLRSETTVAGKNYVTIMDLNTKTNYAINDEARTITQVPLSEPASAQWQPIGNKVIEGHPCQGKRTTQGRIVMETWTGDDTDCAVLITTNGSPMQKLKSWSAANPSPSLFALPAGYKTVDIGAMMKGIHPY